MDKGKQFQMYHGSRAEIPHGDFIFPTNTPEAWATNSPEDAHEYGRLKIPHGMSKNDPVNVYKVLPLSKDYKTVKGPKGQTHYSTTEGFLVIGKHEQPDK